MAQRDTTTMSREDFYRHMKDKAEFWKSAVEIGRDFAVFTFTYLYEAQRAYESLLNYMGYYNYRGDHEGNKIVIINKAG